MFFNSYKAETVRPALNTLTLLSKYMRVTSGALNFQIFEIFPQKSSSLDNFILKRYNFGQFSPSESEKYGEIITFL